ncbi:MAG: TonB-dependent receptor [Calditrichia bacterium]
MKRFLGIWMFFISAFLITSLWSKEPTGTIAGKVLDGRRKFPLIGAEIQIKGQSIGAATDLDGYYEIRNVPAGTYVLIASYLGYREVYKTDVVVKPQRTTFLNFELLPTEIAGETVTVTAGYFPELSEAGMRTIAFSSEEIRRAPGAAGDVSRILMSLPAVAKVNDQSNGLIVRGGSPMENQILLDGFQIPNINHFPVQGSTAGPISVLNADLIEDVTFTAGGFSAEYGDRLSAIMDISLREGNKKETNYQVDLNIAGFGGLWEGPLHNGKGSFLVNVRRSYLDFVVDWFNTGTTLAPRYGDFLTKLNFQLNNNQSLSLLALYSDDYIHSNYSVALENDMTSFGNQDDKMWLAGLKWQALWNKKHISEFRFSYSGLNFDDRAYDLNSQNLLLKNRSEEPVWSIDWVDFLKLHQRLFLKLGANIRGHFSRYRQTYGQWIQNEYTSSEINKEYKEYDWNGFAMANWQLTNKVNGNFGLRWIYYSWYDKIKVSPRFSISYDINTISSLRIAFGEYYQTLPALFLVQLQTGTAKILRNRQWVAGYHLLLSENTRLTLEAYSKAYENMPIDPNMPQYNVLDEVYGQFYFYGKHQTLNFTGRAKSAGIELTVQKKMAKNLYGLASIALSRNQYRDGKGVWRNRISDNRIVISLEGGYKFNKKYELSGRWIYAGGSPYTPVNLPASIEAERTVLDDARFNGERYPAYHSLNLRMDRRFYFQRTSLTLYISAWNVYDRKNVAQYYYNNQLKSVKAIYQWRLLPLFGFEYEF